MKLSNWSLWEAAPTAHVPPAIRQLQELPYSDTLLAALDQQPGSVASFFWCNCTDHRVTACPELARVRGNPSALRTVMHLLGRSSSQPGSLPPGSPHRDPQRVPFPTKHQCDRIVNALPSDNAWNDVDSYKETGSVPDNEQSQDLVEDPGPDFLISPPTDNLHHPSSAATDEPGHHLSSSSRGYN
jgi:hypothetical protein